MFFFLYDACTETSFMKYSFFSIIILPVSDQLLQLVAISIKTFQMRDCSMVCIEDFQQIM